MKLPVTFFYVYSTILSHDQMWLAMVIVRDHVDTVQLEKALYGINTKKQQQARWLNSESTTPKFPERINAHGHPFRLRFEDVRISGPISY